MRPPVGALWVAVLFMAGACGGDTSPTAIAGRSCPRAPFWLLWQTSEMVRVGRSMPLRARTLQFGDIGETKEVSVQQRWTSSNRAVLDVEDSTATARASGSVTLTVEACDSTVTRTILVTNAGYAVTPILQHTTSGLPRMNDSADVIGMTTLPAAPANFLWRSRDQSFTDLGSCRPVDINNRRQVTCSRDFWPAPPTAGPRVWENGIVSTRDTVLHLDGYINDSGHVATRYGDRQWIWKAPGVVDTTTPRCEANTFNGRSHLAGRFYWGLYWTACRKIADTAEYLGGLGGRFASVADLNERDDGVGSSEWSATRGSEAALWRAGSRNAEPLVPRTFFRNDIAEGASGVNDSLEIVGGGAHGAFYWKNGKLGLLTLLLVDPEWQVTSALGITNSGRILATARKGTTDWLVLLDREPAVSRRHSAAVLRP